MNLSAPEIRVLGCLMEKQHTTPDQYPLSLNALRLACNQLTNREPVVEYDDAILRDALHRLERRGYTRFASGAGSRTPKYRHLLQDALPMAPDEQSVMCVLMLRGAQTPGELKQRAERMHSFGELGEVHETLERLIARELAARLDRRPGQKEERYAQLLEDPDGESLVTGSAPVHAVPAAAGIARTETHSSAWQTGPAVPAPAGEAPSAALDALERRVATLERELVQLRSTLGEGQPAARADWPERPNGLSGP